MSTTQNFIPEPIGSERGLFQCTTCSQTYSRVDHLARHVRTHTQEKPYWCEICGKRFSRIDLLRRHTSVHNATASEATRKRRRVSPISSTTARTSRACEACAEHHLKCEDAKPCRRCRRRNIACVMNPRIANGDFATMSPHPKQREATETELSVPSRWQHVALNEDSAAQSIYHGPDAMDPVSLESVPSDSAMLQDRTDEIIPYQSQTDTGPHRFPPEGVDTLPSHLCLSTLPSGTITPNRLLGFDIDTDLDFSALDLTSLNAYNTQVPFEFENQTERLARLADEDPNPADNFRMQENLPRECRSPGEVPHKAIWRFVPVPTDGGFAEHASLSLPHQNGIIQSCESFGDFNRRATKAKLDTAARDKILAITLSQMRVRAYPALTAFPSAELLDHLIQFFFAGPISKAGSWIHYGSFQPRLARPELLLAMAAYGAVLTPDRSLRKLGFAMQEVVRKHLPSVFEDDNTTISDIELQQAYLLHLEMGLWSGNSRKIEISESCQQPLITMIRRRGYFKRSGYSTLKVLPEDEGLELDKKWRTWIIRESTKRLVYHLCRHDAQSSILLLVSPLVAYSELDLPLPEPQDLWLAGTAAEWKLLYHEKYSNKMMRISSLNECVANLDLLKSSKASIDSGLSCSAVLYALWGLIWEYRKVSVLFCGQPRIWDSGTAIIARYQELTKIFDYYRISFSSESLLLLELLSMHLHMSLEEIQLFLGFEGIEQERRVHQSVQEWVRSKTSRQAVWHAGQVFRAAKLLPPLHLRDFYAVSLFHASLALWAYGQAFRMFSLAADAHNPPIRGSFSPSPNQTILLDGEETAESYRYISLGIGVPIVQGARHGTPPAQLSDPVAILNVIIDTLRQGDSERQLPNSPLVENLILIMKHLRDKTLGCHHPVHD